MATDDELRKMEKYLSGIFNQAGKDLMDKALKYMSDFARKDEVKKSKVDSGEITEDEYKEWRKNQLLYGEHWTRLIQLVQKEMADCNKTALDYVNDKTTKIFADSYNSIAKVIDDSVVEGYSFELVDANTVKNLARSEEIILPPKKNLDVQKDKLWNAKQVNAQLLQGILQGESIPKIAARMQNVCDSNKAASIRNARTMVTAAENSGRQSGMNKAESDGIEFKKMWIATRDERTRESHMVLNGQLVANGEKFVTINGDEIEFPGDWRAEPKEVYNCRCTLGTIVVGFKPDILRERIEDNTDAIDANTSSDSYSFEIESQHNSTTEDMQKRAEAMNILLEGENAFYAKDENTDYNAINTEQLIVLADRLTELENEFGIIEKIRKYSNTEKSVFYESNESILKVDMSNGNMYFNPKYLGLSIEEYSDIIRTRVKNNYFMPCNEEYLDKYAITHEYGHLILGWYISEKRGEKYSRTELDVVNMIIEARAEIEIIAMNINPNYNVNDCISVYGCSNDREFFAECFANLMCGRPNELGLAMNSWLKMKGVL